MSGCGGVQAAFESQSDLIAILTEASPYLRDAGATILASLGDGVISVSQGRTVPDLV